MRREEGQTNTVTVMGLYESFSAVDPVVEYLLDQGFSHTDIALLSGHYWPEILSSMGQAGEIERIPVRGREVYLQVTAEGDRAELAREILCNSGPLDVRVRLEENEGDQVREFEELEQVH